MKDESLNIYDIASIAGVSIATVSRVLNGSNKVSDKTREKVLKIIADVGYTPNVFAQGLGLKTMHTVGILVPDISDPFMSTAVFYLERQLALFGYDCILSCSGTDPEGKKKNLELLVSKQVDALVLVGSTYAGSGSNHAETNYIREVARQAPVFIINGNVSGDGIYSAMCDDEEAIYKATRKLMESGRKKILFLKDSRSYSAIQKLKGFENAMYESGVSDTRHLVHHVINDFHAVKEYLLGLEDMDFDAAIASNDEIAIGVMKYASERNKKIPHDIAVIGYNNSAFSIACEPELTTVDNHLEQMCVDTIEKVIAVIDNNNKKVIKKVIVSCDLIERGTTDFKPE